MRRVALLLTFFIVLIMSLPGTVAQTSFLRNMYERFMGDDSRFEPNFRQAFLSRLMSPGLVDEVPVPSFIGGLYQYSTDFLSIPASVAPWMHGPFMNFRLYEISDNRAGFRPIEYTHTRLVNNPTGIYPGVYVDHYSVLEVNGSSPFELIADFRNVDLTIPNGGFAHHVDVYRPQVSTYQCGTGVTVNEMQMFHLFPYEGQQITVNRFSMFYCEPLARAGILGDAYFIRQMGPNDRSWFVGSLSIGPTSSLPNNSTRGFLEIPMMAGPPSGSTPDVLPAKAAIVFDNVNNKLYLFPAGGTQWKSMSVA